MGTGPIVGVAHEAPAAERWVRRGLHSLWGVRIGLGDRHVPRIRAATIPEHKAQTRAEILEAAFHLFTNLGFARTRLTDVAAAVGLGRTTLYEYFPNKVELFLALIDDRIPPLVDEVTQSLPDDGAPGARIVGLFRGCFQLLVTEPNLARVLFLVGRELPSDARSRMWHVLDPASEELGRMCRELSDGLGGVDVRHVSRAIGDLLVGGLEEALASRDLVRAVPDILDARIRFLPSWSAS